LRKTLQRQAIIEELQSSKSHPTASEVHRAVRRRINNVSLGTIYRNLEKLVSAGMVRKLDMGKGEARFDMITEPHHHVRCSHCGLLADIDDIPEGILPAGFISENGFEITGYKLEYLGICSSCRTANNELESSYSKHSE
jgi:Fur family ferric uptake transcriptional regulator